jgi:hypothetical protein
MLPTVAKRKLSRASLATLSLAAAATVVRGALQDAHTFGLPKRKKAKGGVVRLDYKSLADVAAYSVASGLAPLAPAVAVVTTSVPRA